MFLQLNPSRLLTVVEVAHLLKCSPQTVQRRIRSGHLPATKPPGSCEWRIAPNDLTAYLTGTTMSYPQCPPVHRSDNNVHYSEIDVEHEISRCINAIALDLTELGSDLDPVRLFYLEALGYVVDPITGYVSEVGHEW